MKTRIRLILFAFAMSIVPASQAQTPMGSSFTYQGQLQLHTIPANGIFDFQVTLFDTPEEGNQVGVLNTLEDVNVMDGLFILELDFGEIFSGAAMWIEIGVRDGQSEEPHTILSPRQRITATPNALFAANAGDAEVSSLNAADGDPTDALLIDNEGHVGIGEPPLNNTQLDIYKDPGNAKVLRATEGDYEFFFDYEPKVGGNFVIKNLSGRQWSIRNRTNGNFEIRDDTAGPARLLIDPQGQVGIGFADNSQTGPEALLHVNGDAIKPGGGSWSTPSDARLKTVHGTFTRGLDALDGLRPTYYRYQEENALGLHAEDMHIGLLAQDLQAAIPEAVEESADGLLFVNNDPLIWAMLNAINELRDENQKLKSELCSDHSEWEFCD